MNKIGEIMRNQILKVLSNSTDAPPNVGTSYYHTLSRLRLETNKNIFILWGVFMGLTSCSLSNSAPTPPLKIPIALHQAGTVLETEVEIEQDDRVTLQLKFFVNDQAGDRDRLLAFVGSFGKPGTPIPLKVQLLKRVAPKDEVVLEKTYITSELAGIATDFLDRKIAELSIASGTYLIRLETIEAFPQLSETKVQFAIYYIRPPKF